MACASAGMAGNTVRDACPACRAPVETWEAFGNIGLRCHGGWQKWSALPQRLAQLVGTSHTPTTPAKVVSTGWSNSKHALQGVRFAFRQIAGRIGARPSLHDDGVDPVRDVTIGEREGRRDDRAMLALLCASKRKRVSQFARRSNFRTCSNDADAIACFAVSQPNSRLSRTCLKLSRHGS